MKNDKYGKQWLLKKNVCVYNADDGETMDMAGHLDEQLGPHWWEKPLN